MRTVPLVLLAGLLGAAPPARAGSRDADALRDEAVKVLRNELRSAEGSVMVHAAEGLLYLGYFDGVEDTFRRELERHRDESPDRIGIWRVLARTARHAARRDDWVRRIKRSFMDEESPARIRALEALGKLECRLDEGELDAVRRFAEREQSPFAWWVLALHDAEGAHARLEALRSSGDRATRLRAACCLARMNPPTREAWVAAGGKDAAIAALAGGDPAERLAACRTLGEVGLPAERGLLAPLMADPDPEVRVQAAIALLRMERRDPKRMQVADWVVIALYATGMLLIGWFYARRTRTTDDYLLGGRRMRSWMVGLSLFATLLSTLTYMAYPGEVIRHGPMIAAGLLSIPIIIVVVGWLLIPAFTRLRVTSANEILEARLGVSIRVLGSFFFLSLRLLWMAMIIYLTTRAVIEPVMGLDSSLTPWVCALLGMVTVVYTSAGGLRAVVLTDVVQTFILFLGALLSIALITAHFGGVGWWPASWPPNWDGPVLWFDPDARVTLAGAMMMTFFWFVSTAGSDQMAVQRYLATRSTRAARSAFTTSMLTNLLSTTLLMLLGFALLAYFLANPHRLADGMNVAANADRIFPHFIVSGLPAGVTGLVVAALLAAAMSSLSSGLNSACTVVTVDFLDRFGAGARDDRQHLRRARLVSWAIGIVVIVLSLLVGKVEGNFMEVVNKVGNLLVAPLFLLFFMALFVPWANVVGTWAGAAAGVAVAVAIAFHEVLGLSFIWIMPCSLLAGIAVGAAVSAVTTRRIP